MSISFTQYNVGHQMNLVHAGRTLTNSLFELGFTAMNSIVSVCYDPSDNSFVDEENLGIAPIELMSTSGSLELLKRQTGFVVTYSNSKVKISLSVRFINHDTTSICMLEISDRDFFRFFKTNNIQLLVNVLLVSGKCIDATAGFGAMETEWEPYGEDNVIQFIIDGPPGYEGKRPPTGLIRTSYLESNKQLSREIQRYFDLFEKDGYTILIRKGAAQLFSSL